MAQIRKTKKTVSQEEKLRLQAEVEQQPTPSPEGRFHNESAIDLTAKLTPDATGQGSFARELVQVVGLVPKLPKTALKPVEGADAARATEPGESESTWPVWANPWLAEGARLNVSFARMAGHAIETGFMFSMSVALRLYLSRVLGVHDLFGGLSTEAFFGGTDLLLAGRFFWRFFRRP